jgi:hypothetical protein
MLARRVAGFGKQIVPQAASGAAARKIFAGRRRAALWSEISGNEN